MGTNLKLVVLDASFQIEDLPMSFRQRCLPQIRHVTFAGKNLVRRQSEEFDVRYKYDFDLRQMSALKTLHVRDRNEPHLKKVYVEYDEAILRSYAFGAKDQEWIRYWFEQQATLSRLEETFRNEQTDPELKDIIDEKNANRYWLRDLMLNPRKRNFQIVKRLQVTLELIQLPAHIPRDHRPVTESQLRGRTIVYIDFDFDIDTRKMLKRLVSDHKDRTLERPRSIYIQGRGGDTPMGTSSDVDWIIPDPPRSWSEEDDSDIDESDTSDEE
jgi:hypothetical protein